MRHDYNDLDLKDAHNQGYWWGVAAGASSMFLLILFIGLYLEL